MGLHDGGQSVSVPGVTGIGVQAVLPDSLDSFGRPMLAHASDEGQARHGHMLDGLGLVVSIPVATGQVIIEIDASARDRWGGAVLGELLGEPFPTGLHITLLQARDAALGIVVPAMVDICEARCGAQFLCEQGPPMVQPLAVHAFVRAVGSRFPSALWVHAPAGEQDVQMGVVSTGSTAGLQNDDGPYGQWGPGTGLDDVEEAVVPGLHEAVEQIGISVEVAPEEIRHGEDFMSVRDLQEEPSADEIRPAVRIHLGARQAEAGLAGEGDSAGFSARAAAILDKSHFLGITAIEHLLDDLIVLVTIIGWIGLFELGPVIPKDLLECSLINPFHGDPQTP